MVVRVNGGQITQQEKVTSAVHLILPIELFNYAILKYLT
jgi:hypothetical protein